MSPTPGSSDYRSTSNQTVPSPTEAVIDQVEEAAQDPGAFASEIVGAIKERPYGTMALAGGLAFAIGALWMVRRQQPQTSYQTMLARLPSLPDRQSLWPARWR
jgi:hypothetical protein